MVRHSHKHSIDKIADVFIWNCRFDEWWWVNVAKWLWFYRCNILFIDLESIAEMIWEWS